jgi:alkanesulfonate monooxygenase SsuD/methylene tetrahydromethanopterin reductase-like flavin-dependent oxidoreductase (luciferase family)
VFIASSEFYDAARTQAQALGSDPDAVYIPHPIQDRTDDEIRALADNALESILNNLFIDRGPLKDYIKS